MKTPTKKTPAKTPHLSFHWWKTATGEFRWHLQARNNRILAESGESYKNRLDCLHTIEKICEHAFAAQVEERRSVGAAEVSDPRSAVRKTDL